MADADNGPLIALAQLEQLRLLQTRFDEVFADPHSGNTDAVARTITRQLQRP